MNDLVSVLVLSLVAMANPALLAAVTRNAAPPEPRPMLGYLLGAYTTSIAAGLLIVFSLHGSSAENTSKRKISPIEDIVIDLLNLAIAYAVATGRDARLQRRRQRRKETRRAAATTKTTWSQRMLARGSARLTFVVGAPLSFPGLPTWTRSTTSSSSTPARSPQSLLVLYFRVMQQILLELPLLGYTFAPERTRATVTGFKAWLTRSGRRAAVIGLAAIGLLLLGRGLYGSRADPAAASANGASPADARPRSAHGRKHVAKAARSPVDHHTKPRTSTEVKGGRDRRAAISLAARQSRFCDPREPRRRRRRPATKSSPKR